jgi:hypothetical protein
MRAIAEEDVARVFDDCCVQRLASIAKLPRGANVEHFGNGIRNAALIYSRDAREPSVNDMHKEIVALHYAAERRLYASLTALLDNLSTKASDMLNLRGMGSGFGNPRTLPTLTARHGPRGITAAVTKLPSSDTLRDERLREKACDAIVMLCRTGGRHIEGRKRPSGRRSRSWQARLYAPEPSRHPGKRKAERAFLMRLQLAWLEATGERPSMTAHHVNLGPFAKMVRESLRLVGAAHVDAVGLINELNRRRRRVRVRRSLVKEQHLKD